MNLVENISTIKEETHYLKYYRIIKLFPVDFPTKRQILMSNIWVHSENIMNNYAFYSLYIRL